MPDISQVIFHTYRYQILPISPNIQLGFDLPVSSIEELIARKNQIFADVVVGVKEFEYVRTNLAHKLLSTVDDFYLIQLGANRNINRTLRDFTEEEIENWPNVFIVINNKPDVQKIAIQVNRNVFGNTDTITKILEDNFNKLLRQSNLRVYIEPIFEKNQFWEVVAKYPTRIIQVDFELVSPNMANISEKLNLNLSTLHKTTNTKKTRFQLNSDENGSLILSEGDEFISSLVQYAADGAGNITLKIRGLRKKIHTSKSVTEFSIDEADVQVSRPKDAIEVLKGLLK